MKIYKPLLIIYLLAIMAMCLFVPWQASYSQEGQSAHVSRGYSPIWSPPKAQRDEPTFYNFTSIDISRFVIGVFGTTVIIITLNLFFQKKD